MGPKAEQNTGAAGEKGTHPSQKATGEKQNKKTFHWEEKGTHSSTVTSSCLHVKTHLPRRELQGGNCVSARCPRQHKAEDNQPWDICAEHPALGAVGHHKQVLPVCRANSPPCPHITPSYALWVCSLSPDGRWRWGKPASPLQHHLRIRRIVALPLFKPPVHFPPLGLADGAALNADGSQRPLCC